MLSLVMVRIEDGRCGKHCKISSGGGSGLWVTKAAVLSLHVLHKHVFDELGARYL